ncbi:MULTISPECIES: DUF6338 family protein [Streptomyces]|uniref:DUF6338 family protein n=1 Tax=Streptomyces TaxID=1883 RepID=UPI00078062B5|nr:MULTISPECIES: DUF6338 family protein [Streptomyces]RIH59595.1 hypothetical protein D3C59_25860 [Streptomyces sp. SHP22-7]KYK12964.1 hypothetical protein AUW26_33430 [Streptomyces sp. CC71]MBJ6623427.1 hypothetical protein [Streptomyces sp. DHE17-7]NUV98028.1 hypothetical protein [Streptomyces sp. KAI 90]RSS10737.1 hypothetical protein EF914_37030 [Streptomyces sp. WAC05458]
MPSTFLGLVLLVVCLVPGFVYAAARDVRVPERTSSAFRETTRVVLASLAFDAMVLAAFAVARTAAPDVTPDTGRLVREGLGYVRQDYARLTLWCCALLVLAAGAALAAARLLPRGPGPLSVESSWWLLFGRYPEQAGAECAYVGCELVDGSYLAGVLKHFAHQAEETGDRELALAPPLQYRPHAGAPARPLTGHQLVSVSARQIKFLTVTYLDRIPPPETSPPSGH